ncbi:MAG: DUF6918 family protein [Deltaproteobacteria bacterium]
MTSLTEKLLAPTARPQVVADCARLVDEEVSSKSGLSGMAIKGGYAIVKAVKGGIVPEVIDSLLPEFAAKLEPLYSAWSQTKPQSLSLYLSQRAGEVSEALLAITDGRAEKTKNATLRKAYEKLRPTGKKNVEQAVPRLGALLDKHAG